jgi:hypothetical protein
MSLGPSEFTQRTKDGDVEVLEVELFADLDTGARYVLFPGAGALVALQDDGATRDAVTPLPPLRGRRFGRPSSSAFDPSPPEPPPSPVA